MIIEILAILAIPAIASTAFLLGQKSVESRENAAYRAGLQDGYEEAARENKVVRMAR
ncbi:hypothetical protein [Facklamia hominis]|uniref:Uncharacterized protein n=1 Tax=Facklamia hominis CCUG 36813 TaxID=883111 RepID=K1LCY2_9LACT|nr:hypothetical protein [Facklamia hominis]EKB54500.1 hypothetical protein HMPREF9706_00690 [Facklamia hominis CCUG 36813]